MKKAIKISALFIFMFISATLAMSAGHKVIEGKDLEAIMSDGKPVVVVDVRNPDEFAAGHIKGAINIPYDDAKPRILKELKPTDRIVFVCHGGPMGDDLGGILIKNNYSDVSNLKGGMKKWKGAVVK